MLATMVSIGHHTFAMLPRHMSEEHDQYGSMYPDPPQAAFSAAPTQPAFSAAALELGLSSDAYYPRMSQDLPTTTMGAFEHIPFVSDGPASWPYGSVMSPPTFQEDREMGMPSNMSTASAPSAPSSAVGSPRSAHGQPAPVPDWATQGVMSPGIVSHEYYTGTEYSFAPTGMEDLAPFAYADTSKPPGFVGELPQNSSASALEQQQQQQQQQPYSSGPVSPCVSRRASSSAFSESGPALETPPGSASAQVESSSMSPELPRRRSVLASPDRSDSLSSPTSQAWMSPATQVSPFFSQSSGHFIAPLGSSCWFPCLIYSNSSAALKMPY